LAVAKLPWLCARKTARLDWMCHDAVYAAWPGEMHGGDSVAAYRRFVESGAESPPANPLAAAQEGWLLDGDEFIARIKRMLELEFCNL
jgi:hypothetical protein